MLTHSYVGGKRALGGENEGERVCNGAVGFEQGSSKMEIRYHRQRADIPCKGLFSHNRFTYPKYHKNIMYMCAY